MQVRMNETSARLQQCRNEILRFDVKCSIRVKNESVIVIS